LRHSVAEDGEMERVIDDTSKLMADNHSADLVADRSTRRAGATIS
jgi:hypothetical protein